MPPSMCEDAVKEQPESQRSLDGHIRLDLLATVFCGLVGEGVHDKHIYDCDSQCSDL